MFEEPVRFFVDLVRNDRPVTEFLDGKHTFVNAALARHYGMPVPARRARRLGPGRRRDPLRPRRAAADGGLPDQELARACAPAPSSAATGSSAGSSARTSPRRRRTSPTSPTTRPSSASGPCARPWPATGPTRPAPAATSGSTRSAWRSRATAPSARRGRSTSAAGRSTPAPRFPRGGEGAGVEGLRAYLGGPAARGVRREPLPQAAGLRPRADPDPLGRRDDRGHAHAAGRRGRPLRRPGRDDRHEPAVPEQADRRRHSRSDRDVGRAEVGTGSETGAGAGRPAGPSSAGPA